MAITFIGLLFIFFECLPVFVKLMSGRGPYDRSIENVEDSQIHESNKDKDYEVTVIDGVHDTRVSSEIAHRKNKINSNY